MLPPELSNLKFDKTLYNKVVKFLKENDPEMIYIYGGDDPWTASGVTWLKNKKKHKSLCVTRRQPYHPYRQL